MAIGGVQMIKWVSWFVGAFTVFIALCLIWRTCSVAYETRDLAATEDEFLDWAFLLVYFVFCLWTLEGGWRRNTP